MANNDSHSQNPRDITFRPSDLSDGSINDSPEIPLVISNRARDGRTTPKIRVRPPDGDDFIASVDHSMEDPSPNHLLDSPTSNALSKAKTVSFKLNENPKIDLPKAKNEHHINESFGEDPNISRESNSELEEASKSQH